MFDESMRGVMDRLETEEADEAGAFMGTARVIPVSVVKPAIESQAARKWCELYAGGPGLDAAIDAMMNPPKGHES